MAENNITDVQTGLKPLVKKIEKLSTHLNPEFQRDRQMINFLSDAVA